MNKFYKSISIIIIALITIFVSVNPVLASHLDFSKGIMPDNPLYALDLNIEKIELLTLGTNQEKQAELHLKFGTERLNELDYLASNDELELDNVVNVSVEYHKNINQFSKIITEDKNQNQNISNITPKIAELQAVQAKVIENINQKSDAEEVKIIVKSTIKESQADIIQAVSVAKKNTLTSQQITVDEKQNESINQTIENLNKQKNQLQAEIKADESSLKAKKNPTGDNQNTSTINVIDNTIDPSETDKGNNPVDTTTDTIDQTNIAAGDTKEWYYSAACDYVSTQPGKDPICGEELIPVSSLPADHSFFQKYTYVDGKYTQNIDDLISKAEDQTIKNIENNQESINNDIETPLENPDTSNDNGEENTSIIDYNLLPL